MSKTIFITGASSGLGKETAILFQSKGWNVIATMRNPKDETELSKLDNIILHELDVTNLEQIKTLVGNVIENNNIDVVFNNAGYGLMGALEAVSDEQIALQINTNLLGAIRVTKAFIPYFRQKKAGLFITTPQIAYIRGLGEEGSELAWNYEVGARYTQDATSFNAALYRIDFEDQLQWQSSTQTFDNIGKTLHQGLELSARYVPEVLPALSLGASYNYLDATLEEEGANKGNQLPYTSKHQLGWDATYAFYGMDTTLSGFYFSDSYTDNANTSAEDATGATGKVPSYMVWNFNLGTDLYKDDKGKLRMNVAVNNLFDEEYYFRGSEFSERRNRILECS